MTEKARTAEKDRGNDMDTDVLYWIWLSDALGASNKQTGALLSAIPDALDIYLMDAVALCDRVPKLSRTVVENLSQKSLEHAKRVEAYCLRHDIGILPYSDAFYPDRLKQIFSPPVLLYYKGTIPDMNEKLCLGIVGTRHLSDYGRRMAYRLGYELSLCGAYTVSGMARGIDTAGQFLRTSSTTATDANRQATSNAATCLPEAE